MIREAHLTTWNVGVGVQNAVSCGGEGVYSRGTSCALAV